MKSISLRKKSGKGVKISPIDKKMVIKKIEISVADTSKNENNKIYPFFEISDKKNINDNKLPEKSFIKRNINLNKRIHFKRDNSLESVSKIKL